MLGANDGIVSIAALLLGVIASGAAPLIIFISGLAATIAGAVSMALGEYVSVSAQRDTERMLIAKEKEELARFPEEEHAEMRDILTEYGLTQSTADLAATEISHGNALAAHLKLELGIDSEELTSPWAAAFWSAISFFAGALLPMLTVLLVPGDLRGISVYAVTLLALLITGYVSSVLSQTPRTRAMLRLVIGGALGLAATYGIGLLFNGLPV